MHTFGCLVVIMFPMELYHRSLSVQVIHLLTLSRIASLTLVPSCLLDILSYFGNWLNNKIYINATEPGKLLENRSTGSFLISFSSHLYSPKWLAIHLTFLVTTTIALMVLPLVCFNYCKQQWLIKWNPISDVLDTRRCVSLDGRIPCHEMNFIAQNVVRIVADYASGLLCVGWLFFVN